MERQVRRWTSQWEKSRFEEVPEVEELGRRLAAEVPTESRSGIIHGDYRLDNVVYDLAEPGRINAVLDWELSTLGDPMTDLGLLMLFWRDPSEGPLSMIPGVTHLPGFANRAEMLDRYAAVSGADLSAVDFHQAFAHFKFAAIVQGVAARSRAGAMAGQDFGDLDDQVRALGAAGLQHL
ncbi:phosphotransferase family protein [Nocardioides malaquae]|uniref:phosphotransferase family protein n=1 Tax=Nocardioides malaquae TaxID=2773426 RepID=UPI00222779F4|nr:phosphotransferase family protein [Nocardioides malaquae]